MSEQENNKGNPVKMKSAPSQLPSETQSNFHSESSALSDLPVLHFRETRVRPRVNFKWTFGLLGLIALSAYVFIPSHFFQFRLAAKNFAKDLFKGKVSWQHFERRVENPKGQVISNKWCANLRAKEAQTVRSLNGSGMVRGSYMNCQFFLSEYHEVIEHSLFNSEEKPSKLISGRKDFAEEYYFYILSLLRVMKVEQVKKLVQASCPVWQASRACLGRLLYTSLVAPNDSLFRWQQKLASINLSNDERALVYYSAAMTFFAQRSVKKGLEQLARAKVLLSSRDVGIRRILYEAEAEGAYLRRDRQAMARVLRGLAADANFDAEASDSVYFFGQLLGLGKLGTVERILSSPLLVAKKLAEPRFVRYLFVEGLRSGSAPRTAEALTQIKDYFRKRLHSDPRAMAFLDELLVRAHFEAEQIDQGFALLKSMLSRDGRNHVFRHFAGLYYMKSSLRGRYLRSTLEFQVAIKAYETWQSLYALGVALIGAGRFEKVGYIENRMARLAQRQVQDAEKISLWRDLLSIEREIASGQAKLAMKRLGVILARYRNMPRALYLKLSGMAALGRTQSFQVLKQKLEANGVRQARVFSRYGDPLGGLSMFAPKGR